ncbi:MAG: hypothetical protein JWL66_2967 [Sphingomonadales bacterium]|nr:hypothetical protein [Sphingomonadales bacterium]
MKRVILLASAVMAVGLIAPASAETLNVSGVVAPYCNVNLTNVSSGTASVAMVDTQQIANLRLSCNGNNTRLVTTVANGDLLSGTNRINYGLEMRSPSDPAFAIAEHDTNPIGGENNLFFTRQHNGYSQPIANGIPLQLWLNVNVNDAGEAQAAGSGNFPANAAPAGTYTEVFTFTASSV